MDKSKIVAVVFGFILLINFAGPLYPISDFWWHIGTGKWIAEHQSLPAVDPFSLSFQSTDPTRETVLLKGYWGAQLSLYAAFSLLGYHGVVLLKAAIFAALGLVAFAHTHRNTANLALAGLAVLPTVVLSVDLVEARPQVVTFLGLAVLLYLLSVYSDGALQGDWLSLRMLLLVPVLMLLWANMHPGFLVGVGAIGVYLFAELAQVCGGPRRKERVPYLFLLISAMAATLVSPAAIATYRLLLNGQIFATEASGINEYQNIFRYLYGSHTPTLILWLGLALVSSAWLVWHWRQYRVRTLFLHAGLLLAGLMSYRYSYLFAFAAIPLITEVKPTPTAGVPNNRWFLTVVCLALLGATLLNPSGTLLTTLKHGPVRENPARTALDFARETALPPPVFHPYEWGGNFIWELFPEYRTFVDARTLDLQRLEEYRQAKRGHPGAVFAKYGINSALFYLLSPGNQELPDLILWLVRQQDWSVAYYRGGDVVAFTRNATGYPAGLSKETFLRLAILTLERRNQEHPGNPGTMASLGKLYFLRGDNHAALNFFKQAFALRASDYYREWIGFLEKNSNELAPEKR